MKALLLRGGWLALLLGVGIGAAASADTVQMRNGRVFEGKILSQDTDPDGKIVIDTMFGGIRSQLTFNNKDVLKTAAKDLPANFFTPAPPTTAPAASGGIRGAAGTDHTQQAADRARQQQEAAERFEQQFQERIQQQQAAVKARVQQRQAAAQARQQGVAAPAQPQPAAAASSLPQPQQPAAAPPVAVNVQTPQQPAADAAQAARDGIAAGLLTALYESEPYKTAAAALADAQQRFEDLHGAGDADSVAVRSQAIVDAQTILDRLERTALQADPAWVAADAAYQKAQTALHAATVQQEQQQQAAGEQARQQQEAAERVKQQKFAAAQAPLQSIPAPAQQVQQQEAAQRAQADFLAHKQQADAMLRRGPAAFQAWVNTNIQVGKLIVDISNFQLQAMQLTMGIAEQSQSKTTATPAETQAHLAWIRNLTAQRDNAVAQAQPLIPQLAGLSAKDGQAAAEQQEGLREEIAQIAQQPLPANAVAPVIHFSSRVSPQMQQFLQEQINEYERMKDPVYAEKKREEQAAQEQAAQEQAAEQARQEQQRQADEQARQEQQRQIDEQIRRTQRAGQP